MKKIINNKYNLKEDDITEVVKRVKVLIINSKNEILLGYSNNTYQFPGGHVEENESLEDAVIREIREETGIEIKELNTKPFAMLISYYKDYPQKGNNRKIEIYYYEIKTDLHFDLSKTNYTDDEKKGHFCLRSFNLDIVEEELKRNTLIYKDNKGIEKEMLELFKIYKTL